MLPPQAYLAFSYDNLSELKELDTFDQIALSLRSVARPTSEDEYKDYNSQDSHPLRKRGAQRQHLPRLALIAMDMLLISPMSDEPERVFSGARRTVTWDKGQIEAETIELRECLKHWKKSGILNKFFESRWFKRELSYSAF